MKLTLRTQLPILVSFCVVLGALPGCPPYGFEDVYGYNKVVLRNEGDRPIMALFVYLKDAPTRGRNYIELEGGLAPQRGIVTDNLDNGYYTLELEYEKTLEEMEVDTTDMTPEEIDAIERDRVVERLDSVELFWGETFTWYWYGPKEQ